MERQGAIDSPLREVIVGACTVHTERRTDGTSVELTGDLDTSSAPHVGDVLHDELARRPGALDVSLEGLDFLDSAGLRVLLIVQRSARQDGVELCYQRPRGAVRRTLEFARALDYLGIVD